MFKTCTAALLATALIAGPAFVAQTAPTGAGAAATASAPASTHQAAKGPVVKKLTKHARLHRRRHVHHVAKTNKASKTSKLGKTGKTGKTGKSPV